MVYLYMHLLTYLFARSFVRSSVLYHSAEAIIFLGLSSLFFRQQCRLSIVVKSRKTPLVVLKTFPKKVKSELLWQLPHFLPFPCSPPVPMLCVSILLVLLFFFILCFSLLDIFSAHSVTATAKIGSFLGFWKPAHLPLPYANIKTEFSFRAKCWLRGGLGGQFPRDLNCGMPVMLAP